VGEWREPRPAGHDQGALISWVIVRLPDADRTIASGRYDVETPHLSCIARCAAMDGVAVRQGL